ncbi:DUF1835 domain-containing protein [Halalkalibacter lacteus]|uniref:DUF1835 domain-containing protein n=1 Tax=Halalkalibacter lacteus TaxID=3090663 RepID=UPI002FCAEBE8
MLQIVNGDVVGNKLRVHFERIIVWREMYDFGPLSLSWSDEELIKRRSAFFEEKLGIPSLEFIANCNKQNKLLDDAVRTEEVVLWFEHDRYDQTMLMYLITELSSKGFNNLSMVSINQYPGIEPFLGLGQLTSDQLIELFSCRKKLTYEQIEEALRGWIAYNSSDVQAFENWIEHNQHQLPFLWQAFQCHKEYFPSKKTGVNEVEWLALSFIKEGMCSFNELFQHVARSRGNDGLSNLHFAAILNELMIGDKPLLQSDKPLPKYNSPNVEANIEITNDGVDVLNEEQHRFALTGFDWWVGGVHLKINR